ncbi:hypothetical protein KUTeg_015617 [Tegillarca granosa]|uniref:Uncharacterized protein n=1 Tax=Tegillarca granosa TaxID=220873 RepID=A0ABQ9EQP2_TEGGR|nr:hypothetical protein KUTeg_015617 [Tegillarca granosa]
MGCFSLHFLQKMAEPVREQVQNLNLSAQDTGLAETNGVNQEVDQEFVHIMADTDSPNLQQQQQQDPSIKHTTNGDANMELNKGDHFEEKMYLDDSSDEDGDDFEYSKPDNSEQKVPVSFGDDNAFNEHRDNLGETGASQFDGFQPFFPQGYQEEMTPESQGQVSGPLLDNAASSQGQGQISDICEPSDSNQATLLDFDQQNEMVDSQPANMQETNPFMETQSSDMYSNNPFLADLSRSDGVESQQVVPEAPVEDKSGSQLSQTPDLILMGESCPPVTHDSDASSSLSEISGFDKAQNVIPSIAQESDTTPDNANVPLSEVSSSVPEVAICDDLSRPQGQGDYDSDDQDVRSYEEQKGDSLSQEHKNNISDFHSQNEEFVSSGQELPSQDQDFRSCDQEFVSEEQDFPSHDQEFQSKDTEFVLKNDQEFQSLDQVIPPQDQEFQSLNQVILPRDQEFQSNDQVIPPQDREFQSLNQVILPQDQEFQSLDQVIPPQDKEFQSLDQVIPPQDQEFQSNDKVIPQQDQELQSHDQEIRPHDEGIQLHDQEIKSHDQEIQVLDQEIQSHDQEIQSHDQEIQSNQPQAQEPDILPSSQQMDDLNEENEKTKSFQEAEMDFISQGLISKQIESPEEDMTERCMGLIEPTQIVPEEEIPQDPLEMAGANSDIDHMFPSSDGFPQDAKMDGSITMEGSQGFETGDQMLNDVCKTPVDVSSSDQSSSSQPQMDMRESGMSGSFILESGETLDDHPDEYPNDVSKSLTQGSSDEGEADDLNEQDSGLDTGIPNQMSRSAMEDSIILDDAETFDDQPQYGNEMTGSMIDDSGVDQKMESEVIPPQESVPSAMEGSVSLEENQKIEDNLTGMSSSLIDDSIPAQSTEPFQELDDRNVENDYVPPQNGTPLHQGIPDIHYQSYDSQSGEIIETGEAQGEDYNDDISSEESQDHLETSQRLAEEVSEHKDFTHRHPSEFEVEQKEMDQGYFEQKKS